MKLFNSNRSDKSPKKSVLPTEHQQKETLALYKTLGLLPIYEKTFAQLEKDANNLKLKYIEEGMPVWKAEVISEQAKSTVQAQAICRVQEKYLQALKEAKKDNSNPSSNDNCSPSV